MKTRVLSLIMLLAFSLFSFGQGKIQVTGKVTDTNQKPVKGVQVFTDDHSTGKQTNGKGIYKIKIDPAVKKISILAGDGRIAEQPFNGENEINFNIPVNFAGVDKVQDPQQPGDQVNIGYGTVDKKNLVSPVTKVDSKRDPYVYKDIYEMLKGKPGVTVSGRSIRIQGGVNSLMSSTEPLFVVDGVVVSSIDGIIPESVSSIEILKGSSAAIYGSRGANGVIMISLKK